MKQTSLLVLILSALACFASAQTPQPSWLRREPFQWPRSQRVPARDFAVFEAKGKFQPHEFTRRPVGDNDVLIEIMYASVQASHGDVPLQFVTRERVTRAKQFIRETSRSLIEIALEVGYASPSLSLRYSARDWVGHRWSSAAAFKKASRSFTARMR